MVTVDRMAGRGTVQTSTIDSIVQADRKLNPRRYQDLPHVDCEAFLYPFIRGYWITRYLEETRPGLLAGLFAEKLPHGELESRIAAGMGKSREEFWSDIDGLVAARFGEKKEASR